MEDCALYYKDRVLVAMQETRAVADELETLTAKKCWPFPTYGDILFSVWKKAIASQKMRRNRFFFEAPIGSVRKNAQMEATNQGQTRPERTEKWKKTHR